MLSTLRWLAFIPLALLSSLLAAGAVEGVAAFVGGSGWYVRMVSSAAAAVVFFHVALRVAPTERVARWVSVVLVSLFGIISIVGPFLQGPPTSSDLLSVWGGIVMMGFALHFARSPIHDLKREAMVKSANP